MCDAVTVDGNKVQAVNLEYLTIWRQLLTWEGLPTPRVGKSEFIYGSVFRRRLMPIYTSHTFPIMFMMWRGRCNAV